MSNPWLDIPEGDYVGHMSHPVVGQRPVLNRLLREALARARPAAALVVGCSTGNGLEHLDPAITRRLTAVDVNPAYLQALREHFPSPAFHLEIRCGDVSALHLDPASYDLVHAALVLEYVDWPSLVPRLVSTIRPGGAFSIVLQRPSETAPAVTPTPFTSLLRLESRFRFVDGDALVECAGDAGLTLQARGFEPLPSGKAFEVLWFVKPQS